MRRPPQIVAGEPELHTWCPTCQMPTRVRVPLHHVSLGTSPDAVLEICPGCGTGHDRPALTIVPTPRATMGNPLVAAAHTLHARLCRRHGRRALGCAYRDCRWPGLYRNQHQMPGDEGVWRFLFCTRRHRRAWARENHFTL